MKTVTIKFVLISIPDFNGTTVPLCTNQPPRAIIIVSKKEGY
jgi:hypothetical protein